MQDTGRLEVSTPGWCPPSGREIRPTSRGLGARPFCVDEVEGLLSQPEAVGRDGCRSGVFRRQGVWSTQALILAVESTLGYLTAQKIYQTYKML